MDWETVVATVVAPFIVGLLRKWSVAEQYKAAAAFGVAVVLSAVGMVLSGDASWSDLPQRAAAIFGGATVIYRLFKWANPEGGTPVRTLLILLLLSAFLPLVACQTTPIKDPVEAATEGPQSGAAKSGVESAEMPMAPAVPVNSPNAHVSPTAVNSNYRPTASNTVSGHLVTAVVASFTADQISELRNDAVLTSIAAELGKLVEADQPDTARIDKLRADYAARSDAVFAEARTGMPDLSALQWIVNVGFISGNAGATERAPTEAEATNLPRLLTNIVAAARGEATILGPNETGETGE